MRSNLFSKKNISDQYLPQSCEQKTVVRCAGCACSFLINNGQAVVKLVRIYEEHRERKCSAEQNVSSCQEVTTISRYTWSAVRSAATYKNVSECQLLNSGTNRTIHQKADELVGTTGLFTENTEGWLSRLTKQLDEAVKSVCIPMQSFGTIYPYTVKHNRTAKKRLTFFNEATIRLGI